MPSLAGMMQESADRAREWEDAEAARLRALKASDAEAYRAACVIFVEDFLRSHPEPKRRPKCPKFDVVVADRRYQALCAERGIDPQGWLAVWNGWPAISRPTHAYGPATVLADTPLPNHQAAIEAIREQDPEAYR